MVRVGRDKKSQGPVPAVRQPVFGPAQAEILLFVKMFAKLAAQAAVIAVLPGLFVGTRMIQGLKELKLFIICGQVPGVIRFLIRGRHQVRPLPAGRVKRLRPVAGGVVSPQPNRLALVFRFQTADMVVVMGRVMGQPAVRIVPLPAIAGKMTGRPIMVIIRVVGIGRVKGRRDADHMLLDLGGSLVETGPFPHVPHITGDDAPAVAVKAVRIADHGPPDLLHAFPGDSSPLPVIQHSRSRVKHGRQHGKDADDNDHLQQGEALLFFENHLGMRINY